MNKNAENYTGPNESQVPDANATWAAFIPEGTKGVVKRSAADWALGGTPSLPLKPLDKGIVVRTKPTEAPPKKAKVTYPCAVCQGGLATDHIDAGICASCLEEPSSDASIERVDAGGNIGEPPVLPVPITSPIPEALRALPRWVLWRWDPEAKAGEKPRKPVVNTKGVKLGEGLEPKHWLNYEAAAKAASSNGVVNGVGFVIEGSGLSCVDMDNCRDKSTGALDPRASSVLDAFPTSYAEVTVSGSGLRLWGTGEGWLELDYRDPSSVTAKRKTKGYLTVSGDVLEAGRVDLQALSLDGIESTIQAPNDSGTRKPRPLPEDGAAVRPGNQEDSIFRALCSLREGRLSEAAGVAALWAEVQEGRFPPAPGREPWVRSDIEAKARHVWAKYAEGKRAEEDLSRVELRAFSDIVETRVKWLWHARLACGALTLLEGRPEQGKTLLTCDIAARETRGDPFPGETARREPGAVVMLVAEDDVEATTKPRLRAAGADMTRVHTLSATRDEKGRLVPFALTNDAARLCAAARQVGATLVTVDPLVSFMGNRNGRTTDTNNDHQTRAAMLPLKQLAEDTGAAILAIRHYRKGRGVDAVEAGGGSVAFAAVARVILAAIEDPEQEGTNEHHLLAVAKNNLVRKTLRPSIRYEIVPWEQDPDVPRIAWGAAVDLSAGEALEQLAIRAAERTKRGGAVDAAASWLRTFLASGPKPATKAREAARANGFSGGTLDRARVGLVKATRREKGFVWELTERPQGDLFEVL